MSRRPSGSTLSKTRVGFIQIVPPPVFNGSIGWRRLMAHQKQQILAGCFFTVETL
jgi:hypothetical protein